MLFAGWEVRMVKNCDRGQHFQARGHGFSLYGPTLSRQITCLFIFSCTKAIPFFFSFIVECVFLFWVGRSEKEKKHKNKTGKLSGAKRPGTSA